MFKKSYKYLIVFDGSVERYRTRKEMWDAVTRHLAEVGAEIGVKNADYIAPEVLRAEILKVRGIEKIPRIFNKRLEEITTRLL